MQRHFNQAHGTPLTSIEWKQKLQDNEFKNKLIKGDLSSLEGETDAICVYFQTVAEDGKKEAKEPIEYTLEQWSQYIINVKEKTSTSPDGRHYGHYKTLLKYAPSIFEQIYIIMNIAIRNNLILDR